MKDTKPTLPVPQEKDRRPLIIALISIGAILLLSLLLILSPRFVGKAIGGVDNVWIVANDKEINETEDFSVIVYANIDKKSTVALSFDLSYPSGLACDKVVSELSWKEEDSVSKIASCDAKNSKAVFEIATLDESSAKTGNFKIATVYFKKATAGNYKLEFPSFEIISFDDHKSITLTKNSETIKIVEAKPTSQQLPSCIDTDGDGYTAEDTSKCSVLKSGKDCNDNNKDVYPGSAEICNNVDDDCDGTVDDSATCASSQTCQSGKCTASVKCNDNKKEGSEECDKEDLGGASCATKGYAEGTLACDGKCLFDYSQCLCKIEYLKCDTKCVDIKTDSSNCGACGTACKSGQTCSSGQCVTQQPAVCSDTCSSKGYQCGTQTICGKSTDCGSCSSSQTCSAGKCSTTSPAKLDLITLKVTANTVEQTVLTANTDYMVTATINANSTLANHLFFVKVVDSSGKDLAVHYQSKASLAKDSSETVSFAYKPAMGTITVKTFAWSTWLSSGGKPLDNLHLEKKYEVK